MRRMRRAVFNLARAVESVAGDWFLRIHSRGSVYFAKHRGQNSDAFNYETSTHNAIMKVIRLVKPKPDDVVFELGCGKGRAACHFARRDVRRVVGIEISESLSKIAEQNALTLRKPHAPIVIRSIDAVIADVSDGTIFFMFNPFGPETLRNVLRNIEKSRDIEEMPVTIIYMHATTPQVFNEFPWLAIAFDYKRFNGQRVIIYRSFVAK